MLASKGFCFWQTYFLDASKPWGAVEARSAKKAEEEDERRMLMRFRMGGRK